MGFSRYCLVLNRMKMRTGVVSHNWRQGKADFTIYIGTISKRCNRAGLANHLRDMQHSDFVLLIQKVYRGLLNGVKGLHAQGNVIVEVLESLK